MNTEIKCLGDLYAEADKNGGDVYYTGSTYHNGKVVGLYSYESADGAVKEYMFDSGDTVVA